MSYLGIDQSLNGFAALALTRSGAVTFRTKPHNTGVRRLRGIRLRFIEWLETIRDPVEHICMEGYAFGASNNREKMGEIGGVTKLTLVEYFGEANRVSYPTIVAPLQVKQFAGNAKADKEVMRQLIFDKWQADIKDHNVVDAFVLAKIAEALVVGTDVDYENLVLEKVRLNHEY